MSLIIPPGPNYPSPLNAVPANNQGSPREGDKMVPGSVAWTVDDKGTGSISLNLQNNATLEFSQIAGLAVDNSQCGADIDFIFPDTLTSITIPAYTPYALFPVFTNQTQFYIVAYGSIAGDITNFTILNFAPQPLSVPTTQHQNVASVSSIALSTASNTVILGAGKNGTLENLSIVVGLNKPAAAYNILADLQDGNGNIIWAGNVAQDIADTGGPAALINLGNMSVRFVNGLRFVQSGTGTPGGTVDVNVYYRTP